VCCQNSYYDRRFVWEADIPDGEVQAWSDTLRDGASELEAALAANDSNASSSSGNPTPVSLNIYTTPSSCDKSNEEAKNNGEAKKDDFRVIADATRASGTTANVIGSVAPALHAALSPLSAVGGALGAVSGAIQLHKGLSSEVIDPHLVTKGGVTTGVGSVCMALGLASAAFPVLFPVSLAIGAVGLGVATTVDANMDGLCPACRDAAPLVEAAAAEQ